jgi:hypothetical protein
MADDSLGTVWRVTSTTARLFRPGEDDRVEAAREAADQRRRRRQAALRQGPPPHAPADASTAPAGDEPGAPGIGSRLDVRA